VSLFESGRVYLPADETGPGPLGGDFPGHRRAPANEPHHLAAIAVGPLAPQSWADSSGPVDFFSLKGVLERLAAGLKVPVEVKPGRQPFLHPGRSGEVFADGEIVGWIGQVHPAVAAAWGLGEAFAFEVGLAGLIHGSPLGNETYVDFTAFPPVDRDLAVVIPEGVQAASVLAAVREAGGELLDRVSVFDVYRGDQVDDDEKSLALRLRFRASDRTLSDDEVDPLWQDIVGGLEGIGGRLRG
jgi:phenylalanyl-tRNA synthetase beta chain